VIALQIAVIMLVAGIAALYVYIKFSPIPRTCDSKAKNQKKHYEITVLLGSGGHTGELSLLLKNLQFNEAHRLNVLITSTDKSSKNYFWNLFKD
jgi:hypothetical protein